ncbi:hypothetical protein NX059_007315 [Plenodomus lindquistii]|nr:hypothetical protein NX059_007315 [Plenodomus lindquistii]
MTTPRPSSSKPQNGVLSVEVKLTNQDHGGPKSKQIKSEVEKYLRRHHTEVQIGAVTMDTSFSSAIENITIASQSQNVVFPDKNFYLLAANDMEIIVYSLRPEQDVALRDWEDEGEDENESSTAPEHFKTMSLPHETLDQLWSSLIYDEPVGEVMLRALARSIKEQHALSQSVVASCNNTVLLHGPPGSGKTSLALALGQRLSIRLANIFPRTELLEIASDALLSKFFGESSKVVGNLFKKITEMATTDKSRFLVVLFDEVESIAGCRERASTSSEVADAHRAAVQMLRGLDALRKCANVLFICTTNYIDSIDSAFLDRIFLREHINVPAVNTVFEILRAELNGLLQSGRLTVARMIYDDKVDGAAAVSSVVASTSASPGISRKSGQANHTQSPSRIPDVAWASTNWIGYTCTATSRIYAVAERAKGLSGRRLRDLVEQARLKYTVDTPCDLEELLNALDRVIDQETPESQQKPGELLNLNAQEMFSGHEDDGIAALLARIDGQVARTTTG